MPPVAACASACAAAAAAGCCGRPCLEAAVGAERRSKHLFVIRQCADRSYAGKQLMRRSRRVQIEKAGASRGTSDLSNKLLGTQAVMGCGVPL